MLYMALNDSFTDCINTTTYIKRTNMAVTLSTTNSINDSWSTLSGTSTLSIIYIHEYWHDRNILLIYMTVEWHMTDLHDFDMPERDALTIVTFTICSTYNIHTYAGTHANRCNMHARMHTHTDAHTQHMHAHTHSETTPAPTCCTTEKTQCKRPELLRLLV